MGAVAALAVALSPTACDGCEKTAAAFIHYGAASVMFAILAYFCLGPFRRHTAGKGGKRGLRARIYGLCGWTIILCMVTEVTATVAWTYGVGIPAGITFWTESIALGAFGVAWIVSGKHLRLFAEADELAPRPLA